MANETGPLQNLGNTILNDLIASMHRYGRVATGKTINEIELHVSPGRMYIIGPAHLLNLEKGRRPTGAGGPVDVQRYGGIGFKESLRLWMQARGIDQKAFYPIYKSINEKGFPGSPGILSKPLSEQSINKAMDATLGPLADIFAKQVIDLL